MKISSIRARLNTTVLKIQSEAKTGKLIKVAAGKSSHAVTVLEVRRNKYKNITRKAG